MEKEHEMLLNVTDYTWYRFLFGKIQISFNHNNNNNNKKRSHTQLDSRKQVIAFQDRAITINIKEAQHPLKWEKQVIDKSSIMLKISTKSMHRVLVWEIGPANVRKKAFNVRIFTVLVIIFLLFDCLTILLILEIRFSLLLNTWSPCDFRGKFFVGFCMYIAEWSRTCLKAYITLDPLVLLCC